MPCDNVVVYYVSSIEVIYIEGKKPHYVTDLFWERKLNLVHLCLTNGMMITKIYRWALAYNLSSDLFFSLIVTIYQRFLS